MKMLKQLVGFLALGLGLNLVAQVPNAPTAPIAPTAPAAARLRTAEELEKLVAPIALYPDSLVALILPASTESADLVMAARYLNAGRDPAAIDSEPWDDSVKSLARYPDIVKWMDTNLEWTRDLGDAFLAQPSDVMNAVQRLRLSARTSGVLADTPQQRVLVEADEVRIVPARVDMIYIPYYDPDILFVRHYHTRPVLTFSMGFAVGRWLHFDCDWRSRAIWVHPHHHHPSWVYTPGWRPPVTRVVVAGRPAPIVWAPRPHAYHHPRTVTVVRREVVYPRPMPRSDPHRAPMPPRTAPSGPRHEEHKVSPPPSSGPRKPYIPTPPPSVSNAAPQPPSSSPGTARPSEWRERPRGQVPSHGYPTGPANRPEASRGRHDENGRRPAPSPAPAPAATNKSSKESTSSSESNSSNASEESKPSRPQESSRGRLTRPQQ